MNVMLNDPQGILSENQKAYAEARLFYSLARFSYRINHASMQVSVDANCELVRCVATVSVEGVGKVSISKTSTSSQGALNFAMDAIEPKVARSVDWRMWLNRETIATCLLIVSQPLKWALKLDRFVARWPAQAVSTSMNCLRRKCSERQRRRPLQVSGN